MAEYSWTSHAEFKMKYYGLSKQKISGVIRRPDRIQEGVAGKGTIAVMQAVSPKSIGGKKVWKQEVWAMYQSQKTVKNQPLPENTEQETKDTAESGIQKLQKLLTNKKLKVISAWRYPGVSPKNNPIPEEIFWEIESLLE
jgi:hypothetical protein